MKILRLLWLILPNLRPNGASDFSITLTGLPPGTIISGMVRKQLSMGKLYGLLLAQAEMAALQTLLASIIMTRLRLTGTAITVLIFLLMQL
ncbi:MAG: hypothetical protein ACOXZX_00870 [Synergistaceae bacterium]